MFYRDKIDRYTLRLVENGINSKQSCGGGRNSGLRRNRRSRTYTYTHTPVGTHTHRIFTNCASEHTYTFYAHAYVCVHFICVGIFAPPGEYYNMLSSYHGGCIRNSVDFICIMYIIQMRNSRELNGD